MSPRRASRIITIRERQEKTPGRSKEEEKMLFCRRHGNNLSKRSGVGSLRRKVVKYKLHGDVCEVKRNK